MERCENCKNCVPVKIETLRELNKKLDNYCEILRVMNAMAEMIHSEEYQKASEDFRLGYGFVLMEINKAMNGDYKND